MDRWSTGGKVVDSVHIRKNWFCNSNIWHVSDECNSSLISFSSVQIDGHPLLSLGIFVHFSSLQDRILHRGLHVGRSAHVGKRALHTPRVDRPSPERMDPTKSIFFLFPRAICSYIELSSNDRTDFKARELKSIHVDAVGIFLKLIIHKSYVNRLNLYNQVIDHLPVIGRILRSFDLGKHCGNQFTRRRCRQGRSRDSRMELTHEVCSSHTSTARVSRMSSLPGNRHGICLLIKLFDWLSLKIGSSFRHRRLGVCDVSRSWNRSDHQKFRSQKTRMCSR